MKPRGLLTLIATTSLCFCFACGSNSGNSNSALSKILTAGNSSNQVNGPVRGNKESHIYHWPGCPDYDKISPEHMVEFQSASEAEQAGYRAAVNCPRENGQTTARSEPARETRPSQPVPAQPRSVNTSAEEKTKKTEKPRETKPEAAKPTDTGQGKPTARVWVSKDSSVYHCPDSALYGKTKTGEYMTQRAALKKGLHPDGARFCQ